MSEPIDKLTIIGVRYINADYRPGNRIPLDIYKESGIYEFADVPHTVVEPILDDAYRTNDEVQNIGDLNGLIANSVFEAKKENRAVCMTGGNCCHITGVIGGLQDTYGPDVRIGMVWFDAHGDYNTAKTTESGMLGGMPVAVAAGLTHANWREASHMSSPMSSDRIVLVDTRNLDPAEEQLIRATDTVIASIAPGFAGDIPLQNAIDELVHKVDLIYLHVDSDILDEAFTPNHWTKEPNGPDIEVVISGIDIVMATGKVAAYSVVSVPGEGEGAEIMVNSGMALIRGGLTSWKNYGMPRLCIRE